MRWWTLDVDRGVLELPERSDGLELELHVCWAGSRLRAVWLLSQTGRALQRCAVGMA